MKIKELLANVASLVEQRDIIDHGSIKCLWSKEDVNSILSAEPCDEVETGTIGDDDLAERLRELANDASDIDFDTLKELEGAYRGSEVTDYIDRDKENELIKLEKLIDKASEL